MTSPLVSVIVPTFRHPEYLELTLPTVLSQTYDPLEIIVSDDSSNDRTPDVVAQYSSPRVRFRRNRTNAGICTHLNQCLAEVRGKYLAVISDDDLVSPNFIEKQVAVLEAHPEATACLSRCQLIDREGQVTNDLGTPDWTTYPGVEFLLDWLGGRRHVYFMTLFSMVTHTELVRRLGGYPVFRWGSNMENALFIGLALQGKVGFAPEALFQYRVYGASSGLNVAPAVLAGAFSDFFSFLDCNVIIRELLCRLPPSYSRAILRGAAQGSADYYLRWLAGKAAAGMSVNELIDGLRAYPPSVVYYRALSRFPLYLAKQILSRWGITRQWPPPLPRQ